MATLKVCILTDGEYYQKNIAGGGISDPYMANASNNGLRKDMIYIYLQNHI